MWVSERCLPLFLVGFMLFFLSAEGAFQYYDFFIKEANFTKLCSTKSMLTVNGQFPGPTITARKGETFFVNIHNQGSYGITIHWHGVKQPRNPWSDGPENITQCPIQPGSNFTYKVILSNEEGTLWYHAHNDWSRATVHGPIVVLPPNNSYHKIATPKEYQTIMLASWYKGDPRQIALDNLAKGTGPPASDGYTINGDPGDQYNCSTDSIFTFKVTSGKMYMLRIINAVLNEEQWFGITNHSMLVVGQDAAYVSPFFTDYILITPGQTIDVLIFATQPPSYYYMAMSPFSDSERAPFSNTIATAILQYNGNNVTKPSPMPLPVLPTPKDDELAFNFSSQIKSRDSYGHYFDLPKTINKDIVITISTNFFECTSCNNSFALSASANNVSFVSQPVSILQAYANNINGVFSGDFPSSPPEVFDFTGENTVGTKTVQGTRALFLNYNDKVQIVFQGTNLLSATNHPMHIHGLSFYLVGRGTGNYNSTTDPPNFNLVTPPLINTVGVPKNGWVALRFRATNPGVWFIHCHLDKHALWGMATVLIVRNGKLPGTGMLPPPTGMPVCSA